MNHVDYARTLGALILLEWCSQCDRAVEVDSVTGTAVCKCGRKVTVFDETADK